MHTKEQIYKVLEEDIKFLETNDDPDWERELFDHIKTIMVCIGAARNKAAEGGFYNEMDALDYLRRATALGIRAMQTYGYTRQYTKV